MGSADRHAAASIIWQQNIISLFAIGESRCHVQVEQDLFLVAAAVAPERAQQTRYPKPTELPNPYRLVEGWPTLPKSMNGGHWGEVIRVHVQQRRQRLGFSSVLQYGASRPRHLHRAGRRQSADLGIRSVGQASEELWRGTVRLSSRLHHRWRWEPVGQRCKR